MIGRPLAANERISLIADVLSDRGEVEAIKRLSIEEAQSFVDVLDQVFLSLVPGEYARRLDSTIPSQWVDAGQGSTVAPKKVLEHFMQGVRQPRVAPEISTDLTPLQSSGCPTVQGWVWGSMEG